MENKIFREKNIERMSTPEDLNEYLHVTSIKVWVVLGAITLVLVSMIIWSYFTSINSYAFGTAEVKEGVITATFSDPATARNVKEGMNMEVGEIVIPIGYVGNDLEGHVIAIGNINIPDGAYEVRASYKQTQMIEMLFN